jgi:hypothetical protein
MLFLLDRDLSLGRLRSEARRSACRGRSRDAHQVARRQNERAVVIFSPGRSASVGIYDLEVDTAVRRVIKPEHADKVASTDGSAGVSAKPVTGQLLLRDQRGLLTAQP